MPQMESSRARQFDFGSTTPARLTGKRTGLRLAVPSGLRVPDKYEELALRRRQAQIKARRLLDLMEST